MSLSEFLYMGGYAPFVWSSYAIATVVLVANLMVARRQRNKLLQEIAVQLQDPETRT